MEDKILKWINNHKAIMITLTLLAAILAQNI